MEWYLPRKRLGRLTKSAKVCRKGGGGVGSGGWSDGCVAAIGVAAYESRGVSGEPLGGAAAVAEEIAEPNGSVAGVLLKGVGCGRGGTSISYWTAPESPQVLLRR